MSSSARSVLLFSYGTLQKRSIQIAHFGRELNGSGDVLPGFVRTTAPVHDPAVAALIGESQYATVEITGNAADAVAGMVFEITEEELSAADKYEEAASYRRISVKLQSGKSAWVYIRS